MPRMSPLFLRMNTRFRCWLADLRLQYGFGPMVFRGIGGWALGQGRGFVAAGDVQENWGGLHAAAIRGVVEEFEQDGGGFKNDVLVSVGDSGVKLVAGFGQSLAIVFVEIFPSPERFGIDGENSGSLGVGVALDDQLDGAQLDVGEVLGGAYV